MALASSTRSALRQSCADFLERYANVQWGDVDAGQSTYAEYIVTGHNSVAHSSHRVRTWPEYVSAMRGNGYGDSAALAAAAALAKRERELAATTETEAVLKARCVRLKVAYSAPRLIAPTPHVARRASARAQLLTTRETPAPPRARRPRPARVARSKAAQAAASTARLWSRSTRTRTYWNISVKDLYDLIKEHERAAEAGKEKARREKTEQEALEGCMEADGMVCRKQKKAPRRSGTVAMPM